MGAPDIRQAVRADLSPLVRSLGQEHYFHDRLALQDAGHGFLLVAWEREVAVGDVYVWLAPAEEPELRAHLPGVALLTHLEVAAPRRNEGIGTELLWAAEERLLAEGHDRVVLGVDLDNHDAQRLYRRRGYAEWPHGPVATTEVVYHADGTRERRPEICRIMIRHLGHNRYR
ncbi:GNAT family N-acetyltransferase [Nonomuraea bangladeshensis]|uniref:GNAT family N-acetyltransferase n=1 Tax=Nonomuraea bangladeshensis TaxID=404385 RepID=A0ABV3H235_9ACTN